MKELNMNSPDKHNERWLKLCPQLCDGYDLIINRAAVDVEHSEKKLILKRKND
jgi:hypothetical protein